jgi:hypothetical protein
LLEQIKIDSKEFLLSCLTSSQTWLIPLVNNDHWSTYSTPQNWKKKKKKKKKTQKTPSKKGLSTKVP